MNHQCSGWKQFLIWTIQPYGAAPMLLIFMFATTMSIPVLQQLVYHTVCEDTPHCNTSSNTSYGCAVEDAVAEQVRRRSSEWIMYFNVANFVPSILISLLLGSLSDQLGRKLFMILPPLGMFINCLAIIAIQCLAPSHLILYIPGFVITGLTGGFAAFNFVMFAHVADITPDSHSDKRTVKISIYESMVYFGGALSGAVSGVWIKEQGFVWPYVGMCVCFLVVIIYAILLPIPVAPSKRLSDAINLETSCKQPQTFASILKSTLSNVIEFLKLLCHSYQLIMLLVLFLIVEINFSGIYDTVVLYSLNKPLCWTSSVIGYFISLKILVSGIAALMVLPLLSMCSFVKDSDILVMGLISGMISLVVMGSADELWLMYLGAAISSTRGCVVPVTRALLSKLTPSTKQGVMFAGVSVIETTCALVATLIYNSLFPVLYDVYPGLCFYLMAFSIFIPLIIVIVMYYRTGSILHH